MNQIERARLHLIGLFIGSIVLASCGDTAPQVPTTFNKVGDNQTATVGKPVAIPPSVSVLDATGKGIANIAVTFALASGNGTLTGGAAVTNSSGIATAGVWTMGTIAGTNTLTAAAVGVPGSPVVFSAIAVAGAATTLTKVGGDPVRPPAGGNVDSIVVRATDQFGNVVAGVSVSFAVTAGGGSVTPATVTTGANGQAAARWIIGATAGAVNSATATAAGVATPVTFTTTSGLAVNAVQFAARIFIVDSLATITPGVTALDAQGNALAGAGISLVARSTTTVGTSGATVTGARPGQTFLVATSLDNPNAKDSALVIVANVAGPVIRSAVPRFDLKTDTTFTVPIIIDMRASNEKAAAATLQITWDPALLIYVADSAGATVPSGKLVVNKSAVLTGSITMAFADATGFAAAVEMIKLTFKAAATAGRIGSLTITASDLSGAGPTLTNLLPRTVTSFYPFRTR